MEKSISIKRYVTIFTISYIIIYSIMLLIGIMLSMEVGVPALLATLFGANVYMNIKFVQENERIPSKEEKKKLIFFSLLLKFLILFLFYITFQGIPRVIDLSGTIFLIIFFVFLYYLMLSFSGRIAKSQLRQIKSNKS